MVRRGHLDVPVIGVARRNWTDDQLREHARDSLEHHGGVDKEAFAKLSSLLRYVSGDYDNPETYENSVRYWVLPSAPFTTWQFHPACSRMWCRGWASQALQIMPVW